MSTKPYLFAYAMAIGLGVPILGFSLKPSVRAEPNPKVDGRILSEMAYAVKGMEVPAVATPQDKPSSSDDDIPGSAAGRTALGTLDDLLGGSKRAELEPLPSISMEFGTKPGVPSQPLVLPNEDDAVASQGGGAASGGDGSGLLPAPPIFGAFPLGSVGGFGSGGNGASVGGWQPAEGYFLVGSTGGFFGERGPGSEGGDTGGIGGDGTSDGGGDGGNLTGILFVGGGAVPEPASWLLGICAAGLLVALRIARFRARN